MSDDANMAIADYIAKAIQTSNKSQKEIAKDAGYQNPNILSMLKQGQSKLALDRVVALARALDQPPEELFRLVLNRIYPDPADNPLMTIFRGVIPTQTEVTILDEVRKAARAPINLQDGDPKIEEIVNAIVSILKK